MATYLAVIAAGRLGFTERYVLMDDGIPAVSPLLCENPKAYLAVRYWFGMTPDFPANCFLQSSTSDTMAALRKRILEEHAERWDELKSRLHEMDDDARHRSPKQKKVLRTRAASVQFGGPTGTATRIRDRGVFAKKQGIGKLAFAAYVVGWHNGRTVPHADLQTGRKTLCSPLIWLAELADPTAAQAIANDLEKRTAFNLHEGLAPGEIEPRVAVVSGGDSSPVEQQEIRIGIRRLGANDSLGEWEMLAASRCLPLLSSQLAHAEESVVRGVSLQDAVACITREGNPGEIDFVKQWQNSKKLPTPIGKCPTHKSRNLYKTSDLLAFIKKFEGPSADRDWGLSSYFRKVSRAPRSSE